MDKKQELAMMIDAYADAKTTENKTLIKLALDELRVMLDELFDNQNNIETQ